MGFDLTRVAAALGADTDIVFAYLFGSQATGQAKPSSSPNQQSAVDGTAD